MIRLIVRLSLCLLALLALPVLLWWIFNRLDEDPSADAARLAEPFVNTLADSDNAWLHLLGMDAAEGDSPILLARSRLDAYQGWVGRRPRPSRDDLVDGLFRPRLRVVRPNLDEFGVDHWCPIHQEDCIDWVARQGQMVFRLTQPNLPLLQRFLAVLDIPHLEELATPNLDAPVIDFEIAQVHRNLLAQEMLSPNLGPRAIEGLGQATKFWRRVYGQARSMQLRLQASHQLEMNRLLFSQAMDRDWFDAHAFSPGMLAALLDPPTAEERDWSVQARSEFQLFAGSLDGQAFGSIAAWRQCRRDGAGDCAKSWALGQAYAHQATLNMRARIDQWILDALHAEPVELESVLARGSLIWDEVNPLPDSASGMLGALAYNMAGRTLVAISIPSLEFVKREHDREALRRMLAIKYDSLRSGVSAQDMTEYLHNQPPTLREPRSGEPFDWDPVRQEMRYPLAAPDAAGAFRRVKLATREPEVARIEVCADPWWIELSMAHPERDSQEQHFDQHARVATCGDSHSAPVWAEAETRAGEAPPFWDVVADPAASDSESTDANQDSWLPLSVYLDQGAQQGHRIFVVFRDSAGGYVELEGHETLIHYRLLDPPSTPLLALRVQDLPLPALGAGIRDALAAVSGPGVVGIELLSDAPMASLARDMPLDAALRHLLQRHNDFASVQLELRALPAGGYAFAVEAPE